MLTISPNFNTAKSSTSNRFSKSRGNFAEVHSSITFGEKNELANYDYTNAMFDLRKRKTKISGETPEIAFRNFYNKVTDRLSRLDLWEDAKNKPQELKSAKDLRVQRFRVYKSMPVSENEYVELMSSFTKKYGTERVLLNPKRAISKHLKQDFGIVKPKWWEFIDTSGYYASRNIMLKTYRFFSDGLVSIKNIK